MPSYNTGNWYWIVAGSTARVFSSAAMGFVADTDSGYQAWVAAGGRATNIGSSQDLYDVVLPIYSSQLAAMDTLLPRAAEDMLSAYALDPTKLPASQQARLAAKAAVRTGIGALKAALGVT